MIVGAVLAVVGLVVMLVRGLGQTPLVVVLIVLAAAAAIYLWRFALHPRVVSDGKLWVVNPMHTHILEASEVSDITPGPDGLLVRHGDGVVEAWAVQKSGRAARSGRRTRADDVAERLLADLRGDSRPTDPADERGPGAEPVTQPDGAGESGPDQVPQNGLPALTRDPDHHAESDQAPEPDHVTEPDRVPEPEAAPAAAATAADGEWPTLEMPIALPSRTEAPSPDTGATADPTPVAAAAEEPDEDEGDPDGDDLIIRRASPGDIDILVSLEHRISTGALGHVFAGTPFPTEAVTERWDASLRDRGTKVRIAEIDGDPVGYLCYDQRRLRQVGLTLEHTGRGHGRSLVEYAVDDMFSRGADQLELQVLEDNTAARGFYRHLGWAETDDRMPSSFPPHPVELTMTYQRREG